MSELHDQVMAEFRANSGVVRDALGGFFKDMHLLLLHPVGRRSGQEHVPPLLYVDDGRRVVLVGSNGGSAQEPRWVANIEAMAEVTIEVGARTLRATPTVLRGGPERDRLYALAVAYWPDMRQYETTAAGRQFPVIQLDPQA
jgi:deazaflavin-dependent oxidoreductase (nitroreductase family)